MAVLTSTHNLCFEQKFEIFHLKTFIFLVVKFSVYLNRPVLVMRKIHVSILFVVKYFLSGVVATFFISNK